MDVKIYIQNKDNQVFSPAIQGDVTWETVRKGQPGKLSFSIMIDDILNIAEGNAVRMDVNGAPAFFGFIFERSRNKEKLYKVTAYDQLRYLKNKDTYTYENITAAELLQKIAGDFKLRVGAIEDTVYKIASRVERNKTLFDMIYNALELTKMNQSKIFVLYDDAGKLTLKNIDNMASKLMICAETAKDYDYKSSIDGETYNQVKLSYSNQEAGKEETYVAGEPETMKQWGVLQLYNEIQEGIDGAAAAEKMLAFYNRRTQSLSIKDAFGDISVRAGCMLPVLLDLEDIQLKNLMLVDEVRHKFSNGNHSMDLKLKGKNIYG